MEPLKNKLTSFLKNNKDLYPLYKDIDIDCTCKPTWNVYGMRQINTDVDFNRLTPQLGLNPDCSCIYK